MTISFFHTVIFGVLYSCLFGLTFVIAWRMLFFAGLSRAVGRLSRAMRQPDCTPASLFRLGRPDPVSRALDDYVAFQRTGAGRARVEDFSGALYLDLSGRLDARLWVQDTIVTAAPLLGLLGTVLGIMQTFGALAPSGTSDPGAVSRSIGTALVATALGIGTALYGLVGHNLLHRQSEHLVESFKSFLLRTTL